MEEQAGDLTQVKMIAGFQLLSGNLYIRKGYSNK
jgi:hypothetical protein